MFSNNTNLHGTLFPKVYWVQHVGYMLSGIMELGTSLLMYRAPHFRANHAVLMQFILGLWFVFVLGLDPYRTFYILDPETTYAKARGYAVVAFGGWVPLSGGGASLEAGPLSYLRCTAKHLPSAPNVSPTRLARVTPSPVPCSWSAKPAQHCRVLRS